jgi:hypothetical protein
MPDEARTQDAAGAEAFVRYYIELINRTSDVMDAAPLREFSDGCRDCDRIANKVEEDASAGYAYDGGDISLTAVGDPLLGEGTAELALRADIAALTVIQQDGSVATQLSAPGYSDLSGGAAIEWRNESQSWVMKALNLE